MTHDFEPAHRRSATARVIDNLELHGYSPSGNEPDPRPLPEPDLVAGAIGPLRHPCRRVPRHGPRARPRRAVLAYDRSSHKKAARAQRQLEGNEDRPEPGQPDDHAPVEPHLPRGGPGGGDRQARFAAHAEAQLCDPSSGAGYRYPRHPGAARNNDKLLANSPSKRRFTIHSTRAAERRC